MSNVSEIDEIFLSTFHTHISTVFLRSIVFIPSILFSTRWTLLLHNYVYICNGSVHIAKYVFIPKGKWNITITVLHAWLPPYATIHI